MKKDYLNANFTCYPPLSLNRILWVFFIMSDEFEASPDANLEEFREKVTAFLEISFFSLVALLVVGATFYLSFLVENVQNSFPLLMLIFLAALNWIMRAKIPSMEAKEIRIYLLQWIILSALIIIGTVIIVLFYPYSAII